MSNASRKALVARLKGVHVELLEAADALALEAQQPTTSFVMRSILAAASNELRLTAGLVERAWTIHWLERLIIDE